MISRALSSLAFLSFTVLACTNEANTASGETLAQGDTTAPTFTCSDLGGAKTSFLTVEGETVTVTVESLGTAQGSRLSSDATTTTYGRFTSDVGLLGFDAGETLVVPNALLTDGTGPADVYGASGSSHHWHADCRRSTPDELNGDHCLSQIRAIDPIDSGDSPSFTKDGDLYTITIANSQAGGYVYLATTSTHGLVCRVTSVEPVSCSAIIAGAIAAQAADDGAGFGWPRVDTVTTDGSTGAFLNVDSVEFDYTLTTNGTGDHCAVRSITRAE
jgi:hypothetical protein